MLKKAKFIFSYLKQKGPVKAVKNVLYLIRYYGPQGFVNYFLRKTGTVTQPHVRLMNSFVEEYYSDTNQFVPLSDYSLSNADTRLKTFAFYLPQFHELEVNNKAWGEGFTEWTNVTRGKKQFLGHYQPRLPADFGFYNLVNDDSILKKQIQLAKSAGIQGFCFHYYWFDSKRLMFDPIEKFMTECPPDFSFMINWANENWTKRWDGHDEEIILKNDMESFDIDHFFQGILPLLKHPQYRHFAPNVPWLSIYRPSLLKAPEDFAKKLKQLAKAAGFTDLHISLCQAFDQDKPEVYGFDSAIEFPPHGIFQKIKPNSQCVEIVNPKFSGNIYDLHAYSEVYEQQIKGTKPTNVFRGVFPSWDNEARKSGRGDCFINVTTREFLNWAQVATEYSAKDGFNNPCLFINAWNEWAEGAYLEPDRQNGYAYIEAVKKLHSSFSIKVENEIDNRNSSIKSKSDTAIIAHIFYPSLAEEILKNLNQLNESYDLFISFPKTLKVEEKLKIIKLFPTARLLQTDNRGRDILPFITVLRSFDFSSYQYFCKIHTKKSPHRTDGHLWFKEAIKGLLGSKQIIARSKEMLNEGYGLVAPEHLVLDISDFPGSNNQAIDKFSKLTQTPKVENYKFIAGSMFWAPKKLISLLKESQIQSLDFEHERGQVDGTFAHGFERALGMTCEQLGLKVGGHKLSEGTFSVHAPQNYIHNFKNEVEL